MLETYRVPFPVDNSSLDAEDTKDTEESDWWKRGPGGTANCGPPPRPRYWSAAGLAHEKPGRVLSGRQTKKI
jgi:hypothetical protein